MPTLYLCAIPILISSDFCAYAGDDHPLKLAEIPEARVLNAGLMAAPFAISPDGRLLVSQGVRTGIDLRNLATGNTTWSVGDMSDRPVAIAFSKDGKSVVSARRGNVSIWNSVSGMLERVSPLKTDTILALSPHGETLISTKIGDKSIAIAWDLKTGKDIELIGHTELVFYAAVSPDGKRAVTRGGRPHLIVWDLPSGKILWKVEHLEARQEPERLCFSPDGKILLFDTPATIVFHDAESGKKLGGFRGGNFVGFSPDSKLVAFGYGYRPGILIGSVDKQKPLALLVPNGKAKGRMSAYSPDGRFIFSADTNGRFVIWDVPKLEP